jgi:4-hydroxy-2-oxoheptanedioate aldolase
VAKGAGLRVGIHCGGPDYAAAAIRRGFDLVTVANDVRLLAAAARASVARTRELAGRAGRGATAVESY